MSSLAEIEKATEKLSMEQKQQLMSFLGTQMRGSGSKPKAPSHLTAAKAGGGIQELGREPQRRAGPPGFCNQPQFHLRLMATYLADTNLLLRIVDPASPLHAVAIDALAELLGRGDELFLTAQNLIEFQAVATRPLESKGFGWNSEQTAKEVAEIQKRFPMLLESADVFTRWLALVQQLPIQGNRVYDARMVAVLQANRIDHLITFNVSDFAAFASTISMIDPRTVVKGA